MATNGSEKVNRYSFAEVATFATAAPTAYTSYVDIPVEGSPEFGKVQDSADANIANIYGASSPPIATVRSSSFAFETPICGGTAALDGVGGDSAPTSCFMQAPLESFFGADAVTFAGNTVAASSGAGNTAPLKFTSATGVTPGMIFQFGSEIRAATVKSTNDVTLNADLGTAANYAENAVIYGAFNFTPTVGQKVECLHMLHEFGTSRYEKAGPGKITGLTVGGLGAKGYAKYSFTFSGDDWSLVSGATGYSSTYTYNAFTGSKIIAQAGTVLVNGTARYCSDVTINFGITHSERITNSTSGATNGRDDWEITAVANPTITITSYYADDDWTDMRNKTGRDVLVAWQGGTTNAAKARSFIAAFMPNATCTVAPAVINGMRAQQATFVGHAPTATQIGNSLTSPIYYAVGGGNA